MTYLRILNGIFITITFLRYLNHQPMKYNPVNLHVDCILNQQVHLSRWFEKKNSKLVVNVFAGLMNNHSCRCKVADVVLAEPFRFDGGSHII